MREILFRGKGTTDGLWYEGDFSLGKDGRAYIRFWMTDVYTIKEVIPETVGQFIGFCDKKQKKVFEGDILEARLDELYPENVTYEKVMFQDAGFRIGIDGCMELLDVPGMLDEYEVVGNLWDSPELLKKVERGVRE